LVNMAPRTLNIVYVSQIPRFRFLDVNNFSSSLPSIDKAPSLIRNTSCNMVGGGRSVGSDDEAKRGRFGKAQGLKVLLGTLT